jgi:hypothetical protein
MYVFNDAEEFNRDFFGTSSFTDDESAALKALIAYDHYQKSHGLSSTTIVEKRGPVKCPLYSCCNLDIRLSQESICSTKPWHIFEYSANTDNKYCWYGVGVGEFKAHTEK